ncbi:MAG: TIGR02444 family protein [Alphaproteobacteria bacterium]
MKRKTIGRNLSRPVSAPSADCASDAADRAGSGLWRFSLALYARPGVAEALIALQDRAGLDVNLILFGLWIGMRGGQELGQHRFAAAAEIAADLNSLVRDIRRLRRRLDGDAARDLRSLRGTVLRLELAVERRVQRRLAAWADTAAVPKAPGDPLAAALANLACCLGAEIGSEEATILRRELAALARRS